MQQVFEYKRGLLCLSADPPTSGHADLIERGSRKCRELIVGVLMNEAKAGSYKYTLDQRLAMVRRLVEILKLTNVRVVADEGLAVDLYLEEACDVMFRGVRNDADESYEQDLADINRLILPEVNNQLLRAAPKYRLISSSLAKNLVSIHAGGERMLPLFVKQSLEEVLLSQYLIAVTGPIACGKSWVAEMLVRTAGAFGYMAHRVNVDELIRKMYETDTPGAEKVRQDMAEEFGSHILLPSEDPRFSRIDRRALASRLYAIGSGQTGQRLAATVQCNTQTAQEITQSYVNMLFRKALRGLKGLIVVEWAQLAEMNMGPWMNLNAIVVDSPQREEMIRERNIPAENLAALRCVQLESGAKVALLRRQAEAYGSGTIIEYSNVRHGENGNVSAGLRTMNDTDKLFTDQVLPLFPNLPTKAILG